MVRVLRRAQVLWEAASNALAACELMIIGCDSRQEEEHEN
jgi:hypothetical protein